MGPLNYILKMIFKLITLITILSSPLDLDWSKQHTIPPELTGYRYYYGDIFWDPVVYYGSEDLLGLETEIHLYFGSNKKVAKALLILGPEGMNDYNCTKKFEKVIYFLNQKYGRFEYITEVKEPILKDLLSSTICYPMRVGSHNIRAYWFSQRYNIDAVLHGDTGGLYIEISYQNRNRIKNHDSKQKNKIFKRLSKEL